MNVSFDIPTWALDPDLWWTVYWITLPFAWLIATRVVYRSVRVDSPGYFDESDRVFAGTMAIVIAPIWPAALATLLVTCLLHPLGRPVLWFLNKVVFR